MTTPTLDSGNAPSKSPARPLASWRRWWWNARWPTLLIGTLCLLLLSAVYLQATYVSGTEINTATWELRDFAFRRDPFTNTQLTGIVYAPPGQLAEWRTQTTTTEALVDRPISKHFRRRSRLEPRWDLVRLHSLKATQNNSGAASILVNLMRATNSKFDNFWSAWSSDNPQRAAILWPAAEDLVEFGQYAALPELLQLALRDISLSDLRSAVGQHVQAAILNFSLRLSREGSQVDATLRTAVQAGLSYGDHPELQKLLKTEE